MNEQAFDTLQLAIGEKPKPDPLERKNTAAVTLSRLGGLKGGKARVEKLTPEQRAENAKKAAARRWGG